jgi:hypothetical protein
VGKRPVNTVVRNGRFEYLADGSPKVAAGGARAGSGQPE